MEEYLHKQAAPYWSDEKNGVVIPLLGVVLDAKNMSDKLQTWDKARALCAEAGRRMFTRQEAHILMWQKDRINAILQEHQGDLLDGWMWTDTEHEFSAAIAWCVYFGSGYFTYGYKYDTYIVRAVAAL